MSGWLDAVRSALSGELFSFFLRLIGPMPRTFFEKLSIHGRPIALTTTLIQSVDGLNMAIMKRNQLVEFYKASSSPPNQLLALYFGFPFTEDRLIRNILTQWEAIFTQTDDGIFFSTKLLKSER